MKRLALSKLIKLSILLNNSSRKRMASFTIGEVEELTGIKSHILRYWEEVIPSLAPKKDIGGRRSYSSRDLQIIFRLKYLIQEKKFTIEGARNQLIEDAGNLAEKNNSSDLILQINEIRGELLETYLLVKKYSSSQNSLENKS